MGTQYSESREGLTFSRYSFQSQEPYQLSLYVVHREGVQTTELDLVVLNILDDENWNEFVSSIGAAFPKAFPGAMSLPELDAERFASEKKMHASMKWGMAYLAPRGIGPTAWTDDSKERIHILRRFNQVGQTLDGMQTWDIRRGIQALRQIEGMKELGLWLQSSRMMAGNTLYASLFEPDIQRLDLHRLPDSHREGPTYLNILRFMDLPHAVVLAGEKSKLRVYADDADSWSFVRETMTKLDFPEDNLQIRKVISEAR